MDTAIVERVEQQTQRTHDEIVARLKELRERDYFGFQSSDLLSYLPWDKAKDFLKEGSDEGAWRAEYPIFKPPLKAVLDYLPFAWDKANNMRGLSAMRSLEHIQAWLWLAGIPGKALSDYFDDYEYYGKPQLVFTSQFVGFDWQKVDDGKWVSGEEDTALADEAVTAIVEAASLVSNDLMMQKE
jgi:hypothetical protein